MKHLTITLVVATILAITTIEPTTIIAVEANNSNQDAQQPDNTNKNRPPAGKPPEAAFTACLNKTENAQCEFQGPKGLEVGVCETTPDKKFFACNPKREKH